GGPDGTAAGPRSAPAGDPPTPSASPSPQRPAPAGRRGWAAPPTAPACRSSRWPPPLPCAVVADDSYPGEAACFQVVQLPPEILSLQLEEHGTALGAILTRSLQDGREMRRVLGEDDRQSIRFSSRRGRALGENADHSLEPDREARRPDGASEPPARHAGAAAPRPRRPC